MPTMPQAALAALAVDHILPLKALQGCWQTCTSASSFDPGTRPPLKPPTLPTAHAPDRPHQMPAR